jgi:pilus assembly protein Flp/PilA
MLPIWTWMQSRFIRDEDGASLVEYALLVALIAVVAIVAIQFVGTEVSSEFKGIGDELK